MDKKKFEAMFERGIEFEKQLQHEKALEIYDSMLSALNQIGNLTDNERLVKYEAIASALMRKAGVMIIKNNRKDAERYLKESIDYAHKSKDTITIGRCKLGLGVFYGSIGDFEKSERIMKEVFSIFEGKNDFNSQQILGWSLINLGGLYSKHEKYELASIHLDKAIQILEKIKNYVGVATAYEFKAKMDQKQGKIDEALKAFQNSVEFYKEEGMTEKAKEVKEEMMKVKDL
jgi:tetratricopeptide (TPR) repeat protein